MELEGPIEFSRIANKNIFNFMKKYFMSGIEKLVIFLGQKAFGDVLHAFFWGVYGIT